MEVLVPRDVCGSSISDTGRAEIQMQQMAASVQVRQPRVINILVPTQVGIPNDKWPRWQRRAWSLQGDVAVDPDFQFRTDAEHPLGRLPLQLWIRGRRRHLVRRRRV
ncbi:MAG TPA: hypothetical protein VHY20_07795, partial [Pirellulales bacterium]|nr:hypothetical protein [Pirellulales bacterium]